MITLVNKSDIYEYYGLSTDSKPVNCPNGSQFLEIDTGKFYFFDNSNTIWHEQNGGGGGGGATVEPLSVTENGTYTAPTGKAYSPVTVAVPGITKLTATYTAATDVANEVSFPLPSSNLPKLIFIKSDTPATVLSDYALGEIIQIIALPVSDDEISISNSCNCVGNCRNKSSGNISKDGFTQKNSGASLANTHYYIDLENRILKIKDGNNFLAPAGVTYNIECYY